MAKKVYVCFDWENDRRYKFMLQAWDAHPGVDFEFYDASSKEVVSESISAVKAGLTRKINEATHTLVIVGKEANKRHRDYQEIGYRNWQIFEIERSKVNGNKLVAVKLDCSYEAPVELKQAGTSWAMSFTREAVLRALTAA